MPGVWKRAAIIWVTVAVAAACPALADDVFVFVDRSAKARADTRHASHATTLMMAAHKAGHTARLFVIGRGRIGHTAHEILSDQNTFGAKLDGHDAAIRGVADPREAVRRTVFLRQGNRPVWLFLVGPFDAGAPPGSERGRLLLSRQRWNRAAPKGSRLLGVGLSPRANELLAEGDGEFEGHVRSAMLVTRFAEARVERVSPTPDDPKSMLSATVTVAGTRMAVGTPPDPMPYGLQAKGDLPDDTVNTIYAPAQTEDRFLLTFTLVRVRSSGTVATMTFAKPSNDQVLWMLDEGPSPVSIEWPAAPATPDPLPPDPVTPDPVTPDPVTPDPVTPDGENPVTPEPPTVAPTPLRLIGVAPQFEAVDVVPGEPVSRTFALEVVGDMPSVEDLTLTWRTGDGEPSATPPKGFHPLVTVAAREGNAGVHDVKVELTFAPDADHTEEMRGVLVISYGDASTEIPLHTSVQRSALVLQTAQGFPERLALPMPSAGLQFQVKGEGAVARTTTLVVTTSPTSLLASLALHTETSDDGVLLTKLSEPVSVPVNTDIRWRISFVEDARPQTLVDGIVHVALASAPDSRFSLPVRIRRPRVTLEAPEIASYRVSRDGMSTIMPLVLRMDPDGLTGTWLKRWSALTPTVEVIPLETQDFEVRSTGPGIWHILPQGPWRGPEPKIFDAQQTPLEFQVRDGTGKSVATHGMKVDVAPRWGSRGWLLVALAALAGILAFATLWHLRPQPLTGTLLYTAHNLRGTVGKLDLSRLGRKKRSLRADPAGRLSFGSHGTVIAVAVPTRIGGMLEIPHPSGTPERRLLVQGLALRIGDHALRYVSGTGDEVPTPVVSNEGPDLLGRDFDMPTGHVDEAYRKAKDEWQLPDE